MQHGQGFLRFLLNIRVDSRDSWSNNRLSLSLKLKLLTIKSNENEKRNLEIYCSDSYCYPDSYCNQLGSNQLHGVVNA